MSTEEVGLKTAVRNSTEKRERVRTYSDDINLPKHMKRCESSESSMSSQQDTTFDEKDDEIPKNQRCIISTKLEDLITCPIHLGMMEDPRILPCGHAFCYNCLYGCLDRLASCTASSTSLIQLVNGSIQKPEFNCPVCRRDCKWITTETLSQLPPSLATKQLTDYIVSVQSQHIIKAYYPHMAEQIQVTEINSNELLNDQKREIISHLLRDISPNEIESIMNEIEQMTTEATPSETSNDKSGSQSQQIQMFRRRQSTDQNRAVISSLNNIELFNSNYELMDVETIRENMKKYSEYKVQRDIQNRSLMDYDLCQNQKVISVDLWLINGEVDFIVWICSGDTELRFRYMRRIEFEQSLKIINYENNQLFCVKIINRDEVFVGLNNFIVQCSLSNGQVSKVIDLNNNVAGLCIDGLCIVSCVPSDSRVVEIHADSFTIKQDYRLTGLQPAFIASTEHEIWVSCPRDGRIAIIDRRTGAFRQLGTNQIYNAIPSHITVTSDNRVLFLDCHQSRVFWIRKRNDFILIQRISFSNHHNKYLSSKITALNSLQLTWNEDQLEMTNCFGMGRFLLCSGHRLCVVRPVKSVGGSDQSNNKHMMCNIL